MNNHSKLKVSVIMIVLLIAAFILILLPDAIAPNFGGNTSNYNNVTVRTYLNISHSKPYLYNVSIYEALNFSARNITVNAGNTKRIICNGTVKSWEGYGDISLVNATLYHVVTSNHGDADDLNSHYTNASCTLNATTGIYTAWYACSFDVIYYANNGSWICNMTVSNSYTTTNSNFTGSNYSTTTFYPVYALNVTDGIDYGNVAVEDYSTPDKVANLTNLGNMDINITVEGYGVNRSDGLAMNCSKSGNITVDNERFSTLPLQDFNVKTNLTSNVSTLIPDLTISKQTTTNLSMNSTYWQLYIPPNPAGNCTGFIIFTAIAP